MANLSTKEYLELGARYDADFNPDANPSIVIERGEGAILIDTDGNKTIDMVDIIASIGHTHPYHINLLHSALDRMITGKGSLLNPSRARLAQRLIELTPSNLGKVFFATSGSEVCDWAVRIARRATGRHEILSFWGGVYGRTIGAMSLNGLLRRRRRFGPLMPGVIHAPYPYCYRCPFEKRLDECDFFCIKILDHILAAESTDDLAGLIVEPYQGVGGLIFPPLGYMPRLQRWAEERNLVFILDEIQSSFGRTGKWFALEWENLKPNILCLGKGMGGGISISALVAEPKLMASLLPGELSGGNGGNYLACTSALGVIEIIENEKLVENSLTIGAYLLARFTKLQEKLPILGDVRGQGLCLGLEFVKDRETKAPLTDLMQVIVPRCYQQGVFISGKGHILDIRPPLVITQNQAVYAADVIESVLLETYR